MQQLYLTIVLLLGLVSAGSLFAEGDTGAATDSKEKVSDVRPEGQWTDRYELGPGDVLNFRLYGMPDLARPGVVVGPDGTISYLQARRISVIGLTISELKEKFDKELGAYYRNPNVLIGPVELASKRYTILGQVGRNGSFVLNRPITLLEALAEAGGIAVGGQAGDDRGQVDFESSMVVRNGKPLNVDLSDLYLKGDLKQNIQLEAGDYIFIAPQEENQCYVFGSVTRPGRIEFQHNLTATGAIALANGYGRRAWKKKILVVQGSLSKPETLIVDTKAVLEGKGVDVPLKRGDIVYVSDRPWAFAEDVVDVALRSFVYGVALELADDAAVSVGLDSARVR